MPKYTLIAALSCVISAKALAQSTYPLKFDSATVHALFSASLNAMVKDLDTSGPVTLIRSTGWDDRSRTKTDTGKSDVAIAEWPEQWVSSHPLIVFGENAAGGPTIYLSYPTYTSPNECQMSFSLSSYPHSTFGGWCTLKKRGKRWRVIDHAVTTIGCGGW
jgi:hypothetical protein